MTGIHAKSFLIDGTYKLVYENDQVVQRRDQPVWKHTNATSSKTHFLFVGKNGKWFISEETDFDQDNDLAAAEGVMNEKSPCPYDVDKITGWKLWFDDSDDPHNDGDDSKWLFVNEWLFTVTEVIEVANGKLSSLIYDILNFHLKI